MHGDERHADAERIVVADADADAIGNGMGALDRLQQLHYTSVLLGGSLYECWLRVALQ